jgi:hypothetical protein
LKSIAILLATLTTFLAPMKGLLIMMVLFVVTDTIFGIYVSVKLNGISAFKSHKLFNVVIKTFFYLQTMLMGFLVDKHIFLGALLVYHFLLLKL